MRLMHMPAMMLRESSGWNELKGEAHSAHWFRTRVVLPLSLLPPVFYAYANIVWPGEVFPEAVPALAPIDLFLSGAVFYVAEIIMVAYMAMLIRRNAMAHDHDPGSERAYALAAVAPVPLWLSSFTLMAPNLPFVVISVTLAWVASMALIRHGTRPLLDVADEKKARFIATSVIVSGFLAWIGLLVMAAMIMSLLLGAW